MKIANYYYGHLQIIIVNAKTIHCQSHLADQRQHNHWASSPAGPVLIREEVLFKRCDEWPEVLRLSLPGLQSRVQPPGPLAVLQDTRLESADGAHAATAINVLIEVREHARQQPIRDHTAEVHL